MSSDTLTAILFLAVVLITVGITFWASRQTHGTTDYYAGGRSFSGFQNGMAISGDYMSAASFLGISGAIALSGYDGFLYSIGFLVAWLVALLLVAELLRNSGRYTMADQLAYRMRQRPVRTAAAPSSSDGLKSNLASTMTVIKMVPPISRIALTICTQVVPFMPPTVTYTIISAPTPTMVRFLAVSLEMPSRSATSDPAPTICASR